MNEESLFQEALSRSPADRAAFLEQACAGRLELRAAVEALLAAHDRSGNVLDQPLVAPRETSDSGPAPAWPHVTGECTPEPGGASPQQATTAESKPSSEPGAVIAGRYTLQERIGEGGMGEVWVAKQTEPIKRKVALKLIKAGMDTKAVLQRFEAERQALALMDHPNIARVLDGGMTPDRRPYFVMELVNGLPLTRFCDEAKLGIRERLDLFVGVCQAVQHAHQKGIIHRDLKPSNILVTLIDARPVPKVIDFGVAKAIGGKLLDESLSTQFGAVVGTLEYMSPEQAGYSGQDIDTRADIYSLGVILYELLTGLRPIDAKRLKKAAVTEMLRIIQEEEPSKPSTRLSTDESLPSLAALRRTEPRKLMALLRGELDWVVMRCLEKQRDRRYETATGLARDVQRYLADEMVEARPPSAGYRLRKFARKHRAALAAATAIAVLLVAGLSVSLWQMQRALSAEARANQNAQKAQEESAAKDVALQAEKRAREDETKARQQAFVALRSMTADVVEKKFAQGTALTEDDRAFLRGVIAQFDAFAAIKGHDADSRAVRAEGRLRVGTIRERLGQFKAAEQAYDQAVSIQEQLASDFPNRPKFRQVQAMSHFYRGVLLRDTGRLKEAEKDLDQALIIQQQLAADGPSRPELGYELVMSLVHRGHLLSDTGRLKDAETDYDKAVRIYNKTVKDLPSSPELRQQLAVSYADRGRLLRATGRLKEAENDHDQAVRIQKQLAADFPSHPEFRQELVKSLISRGGLLHQTSRSKEAKQDFDQALSIQEQLVADFPNLPGYRQVLAASYVGRGDLLYTTGRLKEADKDYDQAVRIDKQLATDFPNSPDYRHLLAQDHINRGLLLLDMGRLKDTEKNYDQALKILEQLAADFPSRPEFRQNLSKGYSNRGTLLTGTGRPKEAEKDYDQAVRIDKQLAAGFPNRPEFRKDLATGYINRGNVLYSTGRLKEADEDYDQAVSLFKQLAAEFPTGREFRELLAVTRNNRGRLWSETGRLPEAEQEFDQAMSVLRQLVADFPDQPGLHSDLAVSHLYLARLHVQQGNWATAKRLLLEGRPHHLAALKASPRNPTYRVFYHHHLIALSAAHAGLLEREAALRTAETCRDLGWDAPGDAYDAACSLSRCIPIVATHPKLDDKQRKAAAQFYADAAMKMLRDAVSKGYKDVVHMKQDTDLDPLRQREGFKKLIAELEGRKK